MEVKIGKVDWMFLFLCLIIGIIAEESFFRTEIGISYIVFIVMFYSVFFYRFRTFSFSHQRMGYFILIIIWLLAMGYYLYNTALFYMVNIIVIPTLVIFHLVLITSPKKMKWSQLYFISYIIQRLFEGIRYHSIFNKYISQKMKQSTNNKQYDVWKKILIGMILSIPFLFIILNLLISADAQFERLLNNLPQLLTVRGDYLFRFIIILIYTFGFFGFMQILAQKKPNIMKRNMSSKSLSIDHIIAITILFLLNIVYVLFVIVQFKYFFSGHLNEGFTYAEYARRGFFELLFITLINLTITTGVIHFTKAQNGLTKKLIRIALAILIVSSGIILVSAYMRLMLYEEAYGFTFTRVLAHSFMIFLMVIFAYTFVKIWLDKLSLFHFYFIASLLYYAGMNMINIDQLVVNQNIERFETTGKIDIHYLNSLSATGLLGLIELYEKDPNIPELEFVLKQRKAEREYLRNDSWQSFNYTKDKAYKKLKEADF